MRRTSSFLVIFVISLIFTFPNNLATANSNPIASLNYLTLEGTIGNVYGEMIATYLAPLGIELNILNVSWEEYNEMLLHNDTWDLAYTVINTDIKDADLSQYYSSLGSRNFFRLNNNTPEEIINEAFLFQGTSISDLNTRQSHYYDWQVFINELIVPIKPMFAPRKYEGSWSNIIGWDNRWGIVNSLPYMSCGSLHTGQTNTSELNDANYKWLNLQPLNQTDMASKYMSSFISEPLLVFSPDFAPLKTGIINDWDQINASHYKFYLRSNVYWNPSYDIRMRNNTSIPLNTESVVNGINGENSTGINQELTAKDAVFTLMSKAYSGVSVDANIYSWIRDIYVDPVDDMNFHIVLDGDYTTPSLDPYAQMWSALNIPLLPEFFLNDTSSLEIVQTSGGKNFTGLYQGITNNASWKFFEESAFGCGKLMIDYSTNNVTVLNESPYWFGGGAIDGSPGMNIAFKRINIFHNLTDETDCLNAFETGKLDIFYNYQRFRTERIAAQSNPDLDIQTQISPEMSIIAFNLQRPFIGGTNNTEYTQEEYDSSFNYTRGAAIRKAICYAINRDEINTVLHSGGYTKTDSPMSPYFAFYYYSSINKYDYDLMEAQRWLTIATTELVIIPEISNRNIVLIIACSFSIPLIFSRKRKKKTN